MVGKQSLLLTKGHGVHVGSPCPAAATKNRESLLENPGFMQQLHARKGIANPGWSLTTFHCHGAEWPKFDWLP
jgi:hypothetical protein